MGGEPRVLVTEMVREDLPFLRRLWANRVVMRYADEFPTFRGWSRRDDPDTAWKRYREKRAELGSGYTQLVIRLADGTRIGESFFAPVGEHNELSEWLEPSPAGSIAGDVKLMPEYWGRGLGTEAMREVVRFAFDQVGSELFVVPPDEDNPAAIRVYEKAGFVHTAKSSPWSGHLLMTLTRERYSELYGGQAVT
jgi:RimJ/RimL family protein N-acetyltransferase